MRKLIAVLPLAFIAAPVSAQPVDTDRIDQVLSDPRTVDTVVRSMDGLTKALLDLRVGEVKAAVEGRTATPSEQRMTVRDLGKLDDPAFEANLRRQIAESGPAIRNGMKALSSSLPALRKSLEEAGKAIERASTNMPTPGYPNR